MPTARIAPRPNASRQPHSAGDRRVEQRDGEQRTGGGADPERAVDGDVGATAVLLGDQLVDRGVDGGVLPADAGAGEEPAGEVPQSGSSRTPSAPSPRCRRPRVMQEQLLPAEPVGELAEEQGADARAGDVDRARQADVGAGHARGPVSGSFRASDIEPTMVTSSPSRIHTVPSPMTTIQWNRDHGQPVQPGRDVGGDGAGLHAGHGTCLSPRGVAPSGDAVSTCRRTPDPWLHPEGWPCPGPIRRRPVITIVSKSVRLRP